MVFKLEMKILQVVNVVQNENFFKQYCKVSRIYVVAQPVDQIF